MLELYSLSYSPWTEKARWALLHHGLEFRERAYVPLFGALPLRVASGRWSGKLSVPLLVAGDDSVVDSCEIAQWADRQRGAATLFPDAFRNTIFDWNLRVDAAISAGRMAVVDRIGSDSEALRESLPPLFPPPVRAIGAPIARFGAFFIRQKWVEGSGGAAAAEAELRLWCLHVRAALADGRTYLCGNTFTFADIAVAASLQCVAPVENRYIAIGPATRRLWAMPALAADFGDLLRWRDNIYAQHRPLPHRAAMTS
jgi:glutathione S-transferase